MQRYFAIHNFANAMDCKHKSVSFNAKHLICVKILGDDWLFNDAFMAVLYSFHNNVSHPVTMENDSKVDLCIWQSHSSDILWQTSCLDENLSLRYV